MSPLPANYIKSIFDFQNNNGLSEIAQIVCLRPSHLGLPSVEKRNGPPRQIFNSEFCRERSSFPLPAPSGHLPSRLSTPISSGHPRKKAELVRKNPSVFGLWPPHFVVCTCVHRYIYIFFFWSEQNCTIVSMLCPGQYQTACPLARPSVVRSEARK